MWDYKLDQMTYFYLGKKLEKFSQNMDLIISNIDNFKNICSDALLVNDNTNYKKSVVNLRSDLVNQKNKIDKEILKEINTKI